MPAPRVVRVGQCAADHSALARLLRGRFDAEVVAAATAEDALAKLRRGGAALVLVNRVLDAGGESGLDVIRRLKADPSGAGVPVMLVSNYADAQQQAHALGALPGFGKAALGHPDTEARLRAALAFPGRPPTA